MGRLPWFRACGFFPRQVAPQVRYRISRGHAVTVQLLDVVVLTHDLPAHGLRRGDLGAVVEVYGANALGIEFVAASGRTQALVTLQLTDIRPVGDDDLVTVPFPPPPLGAMANTRIAPDGRWCDRGAAGERGPLAVLLGT